MKIAIAGFGVEGAASYRYYGANSDNEIMIADRHQPIQEIPEGVLTIIGEDAFRNLDGFDLVVRTASLNPSIIKTDGKVWSATNEFFAKCPAQIIGVTGTKGKGTTASLIAKILKTAGKKVWLVGNIGIAALDILEDISSEDIVIFELSSFQLWDLERSPHVAVVLLIEPDHLNIHNGFDDYVHAKSNVRKYQKADDLCIFHPTNLYSRQIAEVSDQGTSERYGVKADGGVYVKDQAFYQGEHKICSVSALQLIGQHNVENACAAISVARAYKVSDRDIEIGLKGFHGLPHRIEFVREVGGVKYYNDSFSSAPSATVAAIKSFTQPEILILGGIDKGADFTELVDTITSRDNVKAVIVMGEIRAKLAGLLRARHISGVEMTDLKTLQPIIGLAQSLAIEGDVIVFSPGCASFDMFKDFYDRGDQFRTIIKNL